LSDLNVVGYGVTVRFCVLPMLRSVTKAERGKFYSFAYEEFFRRVAYHPQLTGKSIPIGHSFGGR
jgi:hypothetical protein